MLAPVRGIHFRAVHLAVLIAGSRDHGDHRSCRRSPSIFLVGNEITSDRDHGDHFFRCCLAPAQRGVIPLHPD